MMQQSIGFIGLGTMGTGMARNLARAGFPLTVMTRRFEKAEAFAREVSGVRPVRTAEEVGRASEVVVSSVPDSPEVEQVHLGEHGTASGAARGAIVLHTFSIAAQGTRGLAGEVAGA